MGEMLVEYPLIPSRLFNSFNGVKSSATACVRPNTGCDSQCDFMAGEDFVHNLEIVDIDFATIHVYPDSFGIPTSAFTWVNDNWIGDRASWRQLPGSRSCSRRVILWGRLQRHTTLTCAILRTDKRPLRRFPQT